MFSFLNNKNYLVIIFLTIFLSLKFYLNSFLMAENGDTYDFFRVAYEFKQGNYLVESKRMPLFPLILSVFEDSNFIFMGRVLISVLYLLSLVLVYKIIRNLFTLNNLQSIIYTAVFGSFYLVLDNSFFIVSDTLFLFLVLFFIFLYLTNKNIYLVSLLGFLAFYTRFEGILLILSLLLIQIINKKYQEVFYLILLSSLLLTPFLYKNLLVNGSFFKLGYLEDSAGFILNFTNISKAFGTMIFLTGGFWFLPVVLDRLKELRKIKFPSIISILFILFTGLLVSWGFYIRLYSVPLFVCFLGFIYFLENYKKPSRLFLFYCFISFGLWIFIAQYLNHIDLGETKLSKFVAVIASITIFYLYFNFDNFKSAKKLIFCMIIFLNISLFVTKFIETREKYFTLVQASKYSLQNFPGNVGFADESGVLKWYLKDFKQKKNFLSSNQNFENWAASENIKYFVYTEEMGFQDKKLKPYLEKIKGSDKVVEFKSNFAGGKTTIYKLK